MSEEKFDTIVFKNKTFGNLLEEIHSNSRNTDKLLFSLIEDLKEYIGTIGDALTLAPIIASYVSMAISNNEHIIKMANIVQKSLEKSKVNNNEELAIFSEEDKEELKAIALEWEESLKIPDADSIKGQLTDKVKGKASKPKSKAKGSKE